MQGRRTTPFRSSNCLMHSIHGLQRQPVVALLCAVLCCPRAQDEAALLAELDRIKKERAEEAARKVCVWGGGRGA